MSDLNALLEQAQADFASAAAPAQLEDAKARYLGKAGRVTELLKSLGSLSVEEKKSRGAQINQLKTAIESSLQAPAKPWLKPSLIASCNQNP